MTEFAIKHHLPDFDEVCLSSREIQTRRIELKELWHCLRLGFADYGLNFGTLFTLFAFYFIAALMVSLFATDQAIWYLAFPMVAGFNLLGPIMATAFFEMSRQKEAGKTPNWRSAFRFIHSYSFAAILALSVLMMALYVGWLSVAEVIYFGTFGDQSLTSFGEFFNQLFTTKHGNALLAYGNLVGFLFAFAALTLSVVAFPLALDKPVTTITAITVSIRAVTSNLYVMAVWGLVVVGMLLLGALFFLIGLAVVLPVLGHATWHLYRALVEK